MCTYDDDDDDDDDYYYYSINASDSQILHCQFVYWQFSWPSPKCSLTHSSYPE